MGECIDVMAATLAELARGAVVLPLRSVMRLPDGISAFAMMPAYLASTPLVGAKVITVFPGNHGSTVDSHQGAILLFEGRQGQLIAIVDATSITSIRTAAVSAVATRLLARSDARELAILGAGVQGLAHLDAIRLVRPLARVRVWSRSHDRARVLARVAERHGLACEVAPTAEGAVRGADIVCTTTSAREPVLEGEWLSPGTHVNAVGASLPSAREIDTAAVVRSRLFVDRRDSALSEPGDLLVPLAAQAISADHIVAELGEVLVGTVAGRRSAEEITLFKSLGLAVEDLAAAHHVYEKATREGSGVSMTLGGTRHESA